MKNFETGEKLKGFTFVELIVVIGLVVIVAMLTYLPYRSTLRSFNLSTTKTSLQQSARIALKRMVKELGAGMILISEESNEAVDGDNNYGYADSSPYKIAVRLPNYSGTDPKEPGTIVTFYAALAEDSSAPIDPALASEGEQPLLYTRTYTSSWENPELLIPEKENLKVTQLNFIVGGENRDRVLITLELAQSDSALSKWSVYKLVSTAKLGAR